MALASDEPVGVDHPDVVAWRQSEAAEPFADRVDPAGAHLVTFSGSRAKMLVLPLSGPGPATEEIVAFYRDASEGFETFVRSSDLAGDGPGARSGRMGLVDTQGKQVIEVRVEGGAIQEVTSELADVNAPSSTPRAVAPGSASECFWSCMGGPDLWTIATEVACGECISVSIFDPDLPNPLACKTCAALAGAKGVMCLSRCGLPSGGGAPLGGGGGCGGPGFWLFPNLCR